MNTLLENAKEYLDTLTNRISTRAVGSSGNREATRFCTGILQELGYQVETPEFACVHWKENGAACEFAGKYFKVTASPYSLGCEVTAQLHVASTLSDLQNTNCRGQVLLLQGDLTREQLMPKNFRFYNPEAHQLIIGLLEEKSPAAIIAATSQNSELAGAVYPFPLFEDGDFNIPSVFTTEETGAELAQNTGKTITLSSMAKRIPSTGSNVLGRLNSGAHKKIVICAHVDAKIGTPGALDNAAGVVTLLLTAKLLKKYSGPHEIELLVMNGEDYYGANGEMLYLAQNEGALNRIHLFINMDGLGYVLGKTSFSFYNLTAEMISLMRPVLLRHTGIMEGEPWYQGDHMIVVMDGVPSLAVTTEHFMEIEQQFAHTSKDVPSLVDCSKLVETAHALSELIEMIQDQS